MNKHLALIPLSVLVLTWGSGALAADSAVPQNTNPDVSVIIDGYLHYDDSDEGLEHVYSEIEGFSHVHADGEEHHHGPEQGFNLNHLEIALSGEIDPYFRGQAIAAVLPESAELEEAWIETTCLPGGLKIKFGKFFSDFGRVNPQHEHQYDFTERPLVSKLLFGNHGLNDLGAQLTWLAPTDQYLLLGLEGFQGNQGEEGLFQYLGEDETGTHDGPRVGVTWIKFAPALADPHALQLGASFGIGNRQEEHDGDSDGTPDHWLDGYPTFWGIDLVYKHDSPQAYGKGDFGIEMEYVAREKDLEVTQHDLLPAFEGERKIDDQDGYYVQMTYGFAERWRAGVRWEQVGLLNEVKYPDGTGDRFDPSCRVTVMFDFSPSEFSRWRFGVSHGDYETTDGDEDVWAVQMQLQISLGTHGAHKF